MPLQTLFEKNGFFPGKKCPPSIAGNFLLAGESCSQFWSGTEGVDRRRYSVPIRIHLRLKQKY